MFSGLMFTMSAKVRNRWRNGNILKASDAISTFHKLIVKSSVEMKVSPSELKANELMLKACPPEKTRRGLAVGNPDSWSLWGIATRKSLIVLSENVRARCTAFAYHCKS